MFWKLLAGVALVAVACVAFAALGVCGVSVRFEERPRCITLEPPLLPPPFLKGCDCGDKCKCDCGCGKPVPVPL